MGQVEKPTDAVTQAGTISSDDPTLHLAFGELYLKLGMRSDAHRESDILKQLDPALANTLAKLLDVAEK
jgi:hypothetical protein